MSRTERFIFPSSSLNTRRFKIFSASHSTCSISSSLWMPANRSSPLLIAPTCFSLTETDASETLWRTIFILNPVDKCVDNSVHNLFSKQTNQNQQKFSTAFNNKYLLSTDYRKRQSW